MAVFRYILDDDALVANGEDSRNIGFQARSVLVDNYTAYWLYFPKGDAYVPPFWGGMIVALDHTTDYAIVQVLSPFDNPQSPTIPSASANYFVRLSWTDAILAPSGGSPFSGVNDPAIPNTVGSLDQLFAQYLSDVPYSTQTSISAPNTGITHYIMSRTTGGTFNPVSPLSTASFMVLVYYVSIRRIATTVTIPGAASLVITTTDLDPAIPQITPATEASGITWVVGDAIALGQAILDVEIVPPTVFISRQLDPTGATLNPSITCPAAGAGVIWNITTMSRQVATDEFGNLGRNGTVDAVQQAV